MKRKRSQDLADVRACPKIARNGSRHRQPSTDKVKPCPLLRIIEQYGLLISMVSNLAPEDLFSLAATSKAIYKAMFSGEASILNIFSKMPCAGRGIAIRRSMHERSSASLGPRCVRYDVCGSKSTRAVETHPCAKCKLTTCDECRVHCVFNSTIEPEDEPDELPTYSGFVLLSRTDMGILTPAHLNLPGSTTTSPYHDRGYLDTPWTAQQPANLESVEEILDFDLGQGPLRLADDSTARHPSSVIQAFWEYTEERKLMMCDDCQKTQGVGNFHPEQHACDCTLRDHVLGQWLCLECFQEESQEIRNTTKDQMSWRHQTPRSACINSPAHRCSCGERLNGTGRYICLWCKGTIRERNLPQLGFQSSS